jgi:4-amino-4-deoxy-L-arabinose transferase-like glycosyltransferase
MTKKYISREFLLSHGMILFYLALIKFLIHLFTNLSGAYGFFRDEFYYIACSEHLDWGYVDQPPFSIALLTLSRMLFGNSLWAIRLLPAVAGAVAVFLTGKITRELGGGLFAQVLSAVAVLVAPQYLGTNNLYSMNSFDLLFWVLGAYIIIILIKRENTRWWLLLGLVLGLGLLNKISMLWFSFGLVAGLLLTPQRRYFLTKGPWLAGLVAVVLFLPHILWQVAHDWPTLEFIQNATGEKMASISPVAFMTEQILDMNPVSFPIWFLGLLFFLLFKQGKPYRVLGVLYVVVLVLLIVNQKSRPGYLAPAYPMLFAGGAVVIEMFSKRRGWSWLKPFSLIGLIVSGLFIAPLGIPVLPVKTYIRYAERLGVSPSTHEKKEVGKLPQHYADMHGWEKMVATVAGVYDSLSAEEQAQCAIFTGNYGEAGAVDFLGRKYNLPKAISGHNNY